MIRTLPLPELVKQADIIVIARVAGKVAVLEEAGGHRRIKNVLAIERVLKGGLHGSKILELMAVEAPGRRMEDAVEFPDEGGRAVVFLARTKEGRLNVVNGIQGVWPLEDGTDKTLGMGFLYSIEKIKEEIAAQGKAAK